ncbi:MAG: T9SS type A sorting domain-containing protein, partial [Calditrichia bacterium]|nr:T9SS type A sorting domain-containing protein [Calditrichia bacterium]
RLGQSPFFGLSSHFSNDNGLNWSNQNTITTDDLERAAVTTDGDPVSLLYGRSYAMWVRFAPPYPVYFTYTDDGGSGWAAPTQVNNPVQRCAGGDAAMEDGGRLHLVWAGVSAVSPFTEELVGHAVSGNGGQSWSVSETAFLMNGIQGILPEKQNIRVNGLPRLAVDNSGGSRQGWIYVVTTQKNMSPAGLDPDIILNRSSDGGLNWSEGIRVNQDALNNGRIQYFPAITVDSGGGINVIYYDDRTTSSDSCGLFLSRSTDGGDSWQDVEISDHYFKPAPIGGLAQGYQGDNIDITVAGNTLWPVWMDNSSGIYQIWTAPIDLNTFGLDDDNPHSIPESFDLTAIYPNPFNASTRIQYTIHQKGWVKLAIYDIQGKLLRQLVDREQGRGEYTLRFEAGDLSSGVYLLNLTLDNQTVSRPLILLK